MKKLATLIVVLLIIVIVLLSMNSYKIHVNHEILHDLAKVGCDNDHQNMCKFLSKSEFDSKGFVKGV